jgi:hypothetical protein
MRWGMDNVEKFFLLYTGKLRERVNKNLTKNSKKNLTKNSKKNLLLR